MHYLIDLDNTLLNTRRRGVSGENAFYWADNFERDFGRPSAILNELFTVEMLSFIKTRDELNAVVRPFLERNNICVECGDFVTYWLSRNNIQNDGLWKWVREMHARGHSFHIASNQSVPRMEYLWVQHPEWHAVFEKVFISPDVGAMKPDVAFFEYMRDKLGCEYAKMCLVDDDKRNCSAAAGLGIQTICFNCVDELPR